MQMSMDYFWQSRTKVLEKKTFYVSIGSRKNSRWTELELNVGIRGQVLATNVLSHGKASSALLLKLFL